MPPRAPTFHPLAGLRKGKEARPTAAARGYDARWRKARVHYLQAHPLCVMCRAEHRVTQATVVDHIVPHRGNHERMWSVSNWQALCKTHHDRKTARQDGGFGRE